MFAKKSLGQHFLMHRRTAERIVASSHVTNNDTVLEIGPGTGMLTAPLLESAGKVIAVETDEKLAEQLRETFAIEISRGKLELRTQDVRSFDPSDITEPYMVVANIPYYITGEIIRKFLEARHKPQSMTLLVQKEVAHRIAREAKESLLSLSVKVFGEPKYAFTVPHGAFKPAPKVDSAVLSITHITNPFKDTKQEDKFFSLLHAGFAHKRKKLSKNLSLVFSSDTVLSAFTALGINTSVRAEDVSLKEWHLLSSHII